VDDDEAQALRIEGLDPDDPAVVAAIDLVRWELSLNAPACWRPHERLRVPGVFYTPGWGVIVAAGGGLAGVGGTLAGVIVTQAVNARNKRIDADTKREDRQHERALDYEKRVWQAKNDLLTRLISACRFVKWQAQLTGAENTDENHRRAATIRALDQFRGRIGHEAGISEITAYAAEPVRKALDELLEEVNEQRRQHMSALLTLRRVGTRLDAAIKEPLTDDSGAPVADAQQRVHLDSQREQALGDIGGSSDLDVDRVIALCDRVVDDARKDLQGRYTE
jgi:hypothetical protein